MSLLHSAIRGGTENTTSRPAEVKPLTGSPEESASGGYGMPNLTGSWQHSRNQRKPTEL